MKRLFMATAVVSIASISTMASANDDKLAVGEAAPTFVLKTMNPKLSKSERFVLRDFVGTESKTPAKAVVLSFAASYCEPCKKELAELAQMKKAIDDAKVTLAVVVIDKDPEGIAAMKKLTVDDLKLEFPVLSDRFGVLARRYHANELPMTVIIDPAGNVSWLSTGFAKGAMDKFKAQLGI